MRKILLLASFLGVFAVACGVEREEQAREPAADEVPDVPAPPEPTAGGPVESTARGEEGPELLKVRSAIEKEFARLRNVEGREGILAEKRLYSLFDEELIIRDFFQDRRGGFFLDVGCAWPVRANNTYYLEKHLGWKGIGIDALAEYGAAWESERPNSRFFSYLVTDRSGIKETFYRSPTSGLSSVNKGMASGKVFGAELEPEEVEISTITLDDLLDREGVTKIDLLSMDIEGHEPTALAGFDIGRFQPELVVIEKPLLAAKDGRDEVYVYFERHGYELMEKYAPFDTVNRYFARKGSERSSPVP